MDRLCAVVWRFVFVFGHALGSCRGEDFTNVLPVSAMVFLWGLPRVVARPRDHIKRPVPDFVLQVDMPRNTTALFYAYRERSGGQSVWEAPAWEPPTGTVEGFLEDAPTEEPYDGEGAMWFAVAVILIYGVSIALLVGTTLKRSHTDYEVKGFLRSYARLDKQRRTSEKQRVRQRLLEKQLLPMLPGCSLAVAPRIFEHRLHALPEDLVEMGLPEDSEDAYPPSSGDQEQRTGDSELHGPFNWELPSRSLSTLLLTSSRPGGHAAGGASHNVDTGTLLDSLPADTHLDSWTPGPDHPQAIDPDDTPGDASGGVSAEGALLADCGGVQEDSASGNTESELVDSMNTPLIVSLSVRGTHQRALSW